MRSTRPRVLCAVAGFSAALALSALAACSSFGGAATTPQDADAESEANADDGEAGVRCSEGPWTMRAGDTLDQIGTALAVGPSGEVVVAGDSIGAIDFGAGAVTSPVTADGGPTALFVTKLDPSGHAVW